jgi:molecular chaperone IbpA
MVRKNDFYGMVDFRDPIFSSLFVGFDNLFDSISQMSQGSKSLPSYPPYNVIQDGDNFIIEIALAGIAKKDLNIELQENTLSISYDSSNDIVNDVIEENKILHKGIAQRSFKRQFTLSEDIVVEGANFKDGMLNIFLKKVIPEEKKPKQIKIK